MRTSARAWAAAGVVSVAVVAALAWYLIVARDVAREDGRAPSGFDERARAQDGGAEPRMPQSEVHVLAPLVRPIPTAVPGIVTLEGGEPPSLRWELAFPRGVWSLRFVLGSPNVELRFLDLSRTVSEDCHALSAITEHGPAPFPHASFDEAARAAQLEDMPLEVVEALTRARDLTLVACDARFTLDDTQQRVLIDFYVQAAGLILDALGPDVDAGAAREPVETR